MFGKLRSCSAIVPAAVLLSSIGVAYADSFSMEGTIESKDMTQPMPVTESLIVIHTANEGTIKTNDSNNPLNNANGKCFGAVLLNKGQLGGDGHCVYTDSEGDHAVVHWQAKALNEAGGNSGVFSMIGGSGKYQSATGEGTYSSTTNPETGQAVNVITGTMKL